MRRAILDGAEEKATEARFTALLAAHRDDMPSMLRQSVSFLKSKDIPIHWEQLFADLRYWGNEEKFVQRRWANSFWVYRSSAKDQDSSQEEQES